MQNRITSLFHIQYPIVQGGMIWCSGWKLASAVSNAGGLGLIGAGSMRPDVLRTHIQQCKAATNKPFGVNVPLLYAHTEENIKVILDEGVKIIFTSAGNPALWTQKLKDHGCTVAHVIANAKFARKAEEAGVDALVAEGFEAGGHNGREETTTLCLIPLIREITTLPLLAAGGIASGKAILAALAMGADGVQIGSLFAASTESSAHEFYKQAVVDAPDGATVLTLKQLNPVRLLRNAFYRQVVQAEEKNATPEQLKELLGKGRARMGIMEGDLENGELEIGQAAALIHQVKPVAQIMNELVSEFNKSTHILNNFTF
ncbi:MAG: nitronate monooxygenase [Bacteroidia bacterium]|nr:nitronate monooxygenase [Bacteroidia bacterium]